MGYWKERIEGLLEAQQLLFYDLPPKKGEAPRKRRARPRKRPTRKRPSPKWGPSKAFVREIEGQRSMFGYQKRQPKGQSIKQQRRAILDRYDVVIADLKRAEKTFPKGHWRPTTGKLVTYNKEIATAVRAKKAFVKNMDELRWREFARRTREPVGDDKAAERYANVEDTIMHERNTLVSFEHIARMSVEDARQEVLKRGRVALAREQKKTRKPRRGKKFKVPSELKKERFKKYVEDMVGSWNVSWERDRKEDKLYLHVRPTPQTGDKALTYSLEKEDFVDTVQDIYNVFAAEQKKMSQAERDAIVQREVGSLFRTWKEDGWKAVPATDLFKPGTSVHELTAVDVVRAGGAYSLLQKGVMLKPPKGFQKERLTVSDDVKRNVAEITSAIASAKTVSDVDDLYVRASSVTRGERERLVAATGYTYGDKAPAPLKEVWNMQHNVDVQIGKRLRAILGKDADFARAVNNKISSLRHHGMRNVAMTSAEMSKIAGVPSKTGYAAVRRLVKKGVLEKGYKEYSLVPGISGTLDLMEE